MTRGAPNHETISVTPTIQASKPFMRSNLLTPEIAPIQGSPLKSVAAQANVHGLCLRPFDEGAPATPEMTGCRGVPVARKRSIRFTRRVQERNISKGGCDLGHGNGRLFVA